MTGSTVNATSSVTCRRFSAAALLWVQTTSGATTSLFVPELDRLFVAQRAGFLGERAAILLFRPVP
jgi:hypothetical protein